jgi:hypothetical protein
MLSTQKGGGTKQPLFCVRLFLVSVTMGLHVAQHVYFLDDPQH